MSDDPKKPIFHLLPAILTGSAALIASLTAVYVNLRSEHDAPAPKPAIAAVPVDKPAPVVAPRAPEQFRLRLDRIAVHHDGAMGAADWRFTVEAEDDPLLSFGQDDLDDSGGRNVAQPKDVASVVRIKPGAGSRITVKAWRDRRLRFGEGTPDAEGEGRLNADGSIAPLQVAAKNPDKGAFVLYFSATPLPD